MASIDHVFTEGFDAWARATGRAFVDYTAGNSEAVLRDLRPDAVGAAVGHDQGPAVEQPPEVALQPAGVVALPAHHRDAQARGHIRHRRLVGVAQRRQRHRRRGDGRRRHEVARGRLRRQAGPQSGGPEHHFRLQDIERRRLVLRRQHREQLRPLGQLPVAQRLGKHQGQPRLGQIMKNHGHLDLRGQPARGAAHAVERAVAQFVESGGVAAVEDLVHLGAEAFAAWAAIGNRSLARAGSGVDTARHLTKILKTEDLRHA